MADTSPHGVTATAATMPSHPAVEKVAVELRRLGIEPEVRWLDGAATTAQSAAEALGIGVGQIANSLIFLLDDAPVLVLTSGAHRVDTAWLGAQLGGTIGRASKDVVKQATGQTIGGVAPVGHPSPVRTYVDTALAAHDEVWAAAGHPRTVFRTSFAELVRLTGGTSSPVEPEAADAESGEGA
ncbi:prolyl-tRNA editing enzyme YbaK/EbsC (Cys-tRNA(Pro) deacylase) [Nesterenkonia xinjiangensis]|uniref:Prolyl-tRNA editing enzyme YbaK/EbsC (Cys-tRNA(Pro) deacylase) n=2 Tax=Nesterenkonia xinjiangensis TaxID=225327 RepID=A0A7Z0GKP0_9MICC|nr:YbaK/EbsC family protein [Nesterenkonia xinjiangensis]NYJ77774.1 prolyl-tRNA editing enzyme YbaK/EbsC (Cys-tRNA(Pro) deacylase) [Nesterenkonia xinjiangensis]